MSEFSENEFRCAGIVLFFEDRTVLVRSYRGHYSFPKGGIELGEELLECAFREVEEETGILRESIRILDPEFKIRELDGQGRAYVIYFVGVLASDFHDFTWDPAELSEVKWHTFDEIPPLENMLETRKVVFQQALDFYNASRH